MTTARTLIPVLALSAVAALLAGCGGNGNSPSVASLGNTTSTSTNSTAPPSSGGPLSSSSGGGASLTMKMTNGAKFAACMRKNGVPNFPDPSSGGDISIGPGSGINPDSPKFKAAQEACRKLLPNGGQASPQQQAKMQAAALAFSKCMRSHGVPNFPDPQFSAGRMSLEVKAKSGGLDPNSPTFKAAQQACQGKLPFKGGPGGVSTQGGK